MIPNAPGVPFAAARVASSLPSSFAFSPSSITIVALVYFPSVQALRSERVTSNSPSPATGISISFSVSYGAKATVSFIGHGILRALSLFGDYDLAVLGLVLALGERYL